MIYSQYNNELQIIEYDLKSQLVAAIRKSDGKRRIYPAWSLKADDGMDEIQRAIMVAKPKHLDMTLDV